MRTVRLAGLVAGVAALVAAQAADAPALEYHGYFRSGIGSNSEGGSQVCIQLPGAFSKYRLGNECQTYGEVEFDEDVFKKDSAIFKVHTMFGFETQQVSDFERLDEPRNHFAVRQAWGEAGGIFGDGALKDARVWVGKRYYLRNDVHITDFFYWNNSGPGAGIENVNAGLGKLHFAVRRDKETVTVPVAPGAVQDVTFPDEESSMTSLDLRLGDIKANPGGTLMVGVDGRFADQNNGDAKDGWSVHLQHFQGNLLGGFNKLALQYGEDAGAGLGSTVFTTTGLERWRIVEQLVWELNKQFSGQFTTVYQVSEDKASGADEKWFSIGARPVLHLAEYFNVALEYGYDQVDPEGASTRHLHKVTLAPQVAAGRSFWSRPVLRVFATYFAWNEAARDAGIENGTAFEGKRDGFTYGAQVEAWF